MLFTKLRLFIIMSLLVLLIAFSAALAGVYITQLREADNTAPLPKLTPSFAQRATITPTFTVTPSGTPELAPALNSPPSIPANWKAFNEDVSCIYTYTIYYPPNWHVENPQTPCVEGIGEDTNNGVYVDIQADDASQNGYVFDGLLFADPSGVVPSSQLDNSDYPTIFDENFVKLGNLTVNGLQAVKASYDENDTVQGGGFIYYILYVIKGNNVYYTLDFASQPVDTNVSGKQVLSSNQNTIDQIVSTFQVK